MLTKLEKRIIEISFKKKISHISSCLTAVNIIDNIYKRKKDNEPFILDNGHAAIALYCVLEKYFGINAEMLFDKHGVHPNVDMKNRIWCSTGSLAIGLGIGVGIALADRSKLCYILTSDGAMNEGLAWEALRIAGELRLKNLRITCNANGFGAYSKINVDLLEKRLKMFFPVHVLRTNMRRYPKFLQAVTGHYTILNEKQYIEVLKMEQTL